MPAGVSSRIPGYELLRELHQGRTRLVYEARRESDGRSVIVKTSPDSAHGHSFRSTIEREFAILRSLDIPGVVRPLGLEEFGGRLVLVLERSPGDPLAELIEEGALDCAAGLLIGSRIAAILGRVHAGGVLHRDVNPHNLLVERESLQPTLLDFSLAAPVGPSDIPPPPPGVLEGTLAYLAPEQTGRTSRGIDHRSDLYALGATLYELLTGEPPFPVDEPLGVIHAHLARKARPAHEAGDGIPQVVSRILEKLLAKEPELRYQSAEGLVSDLDRVVADMSAGRTSEDFELGAADSGVRLKVPQSVYGRRDEAESLRRSLDSVRRGGAEVVLVTGPAGIGKTSLVRDVMAARTGDALLFGAGKFDQVARAIPYAAIGEALRGVARQILTQPDPVLAQWRSRLGTAVGANGSVILSVVPEFERVLGPQPPVPELDPAESRNRFTLVFQRFVEALASSDHPLVLFLDDLQWADPASLQLIQTIAGNPAARSLLVVGAYRDREVDEDHPLIPVLSAVEAVGRPLHRLVLGGLPQADLRRFTADALGLDEAAASSFAAMVESKTAGNPFFVGQFLYSLERQGLLRPERQSGRWCFDLDSIERQRITSNVVDLLGEKIKPLPAEARDVLQLAACIGNRFDLRTLAAAAEQSPGQTARNVELAIEEGLVLPYARGERASRRPGAGQEDGRYQFLHDRVQQAAYATIPPEQRAERHVRIGRSLLRSLTDEEVSVRLFDVVDQLNHGLDGVLEPAELARLRELEVEAGMRARGSTAYSAALGYFRAAVRLLPPNAWGDRFEETFGLHLELAECAYLSGLRADAEAAFDMLQGRARTPMDRARIAILRAAQHENAGEYGESVDVALDAVRGLGVSVPPREGLAAAVREELAAVDRALGERPIEGLIDLPRLTDPEVAMTLRLLQVAWAPAYIAGDTDLIAWLPSRVVRLSIQHGNAEESAVGYGFHGVTLGTRLGDYARGHEFGRLSLALNELLEDKRSRAKVGNLFGCFVHQWRGPLLECLEYIRSAYEVGQEVGDFAYTSYNAIVETWYALLTTQDLRSFGEEYRSREAFLRRIGNHSFADAVRLILGWGLALEGQTQRLESLDDGEFSESLYVERYGEVDFFRAFLEIVKLHLSLSAGRTAEALGAADRAQLVCGSLGGTIWPMLLTFYRALALASEANAVPPDERNLYVSRLRRDCERLGVWAENCAENFAHTHLLSCAELARVEERTSDAENLFAAAIRAADERGFPGDRALANERYGRYWLAREQPAVAAVFLGMAYSLYQEWGARALATRLADELTRLEGRQARAVSMELAPALATTRATPEALDFQWIMQAAAAVADEIELPSLLRSLMRILIESGGAERGVLILERDDEAFVEAECEAGDDEPTIASIAVSERSDLPLSLIRYVARTEEAVVLTDAASDPTFGNDPYIRGEGVRSAACVPILHRGRRLGVVYLENNLAAGAFTDHHTQVLGALSALGAIAINNAMLFEEVGQLKDRLEAENVYLQQEIDTHRGGFPELIGRAPSLSRVLKQIEQVAPTDATVLILGETGTGKELIARAIHRMSERRERPMITVNCGAISASLAESELFGHERGAFTGATARKIGRFELAHGGTIFLDEIGDLPPDLQVKLLRVLQEGDLQRVGGSDTISVNVRVIAATHRDLEPAVADGSFRSDLYYRLNVFPIRNPPLRDRREDIPLLVQHFVKIDGPRLGKRIETIPKRTVDALAAYPWPGNVRELRNVIERSIITSRGSALELAEWGRADRTLEAGGADGSLDDVVRTHILRTLESTGWRVSGPNGAARRLGVKPTTLESRMKKLGIGRPT